MAGAGSAMCNTSRQIGAALSSAGVAALMTALLGSEPATLAGPTDGAATLSGPARASLAAAMAESMLLPATAAALGAATALFLTGRARSDVGHRFRGDVSVAP
jgi:hypothetical protein